ncbi:4456_t:CDS:1, partial [Funneliformis caledonium]
MSEQSCEISSPLRSLLSINLFEDKISSNDKFGHMFDEISNNTSDIYFKDFEENKENGCETLEQDK